MKHDNHFSRKKRNLGVLAKRLQYLMANHREEAVHEIERLILRIKRLLNDLASVLTKQSLAKILGASAFVFGISFSNQTSAQSFANPITNPFGLTQTYQFAVPAIADLDNDGDMDILAGEYYGALKYYQNTGTSASPAFASPITNPFGLDTAYQLSFPAFVDIDNDGDLDLFVGESYGTLKYYQNTGSASNPQFAAPISNPFGLTAASLFAIPTFADIDNDGDFDLLAGEYYGTLKYYKNTGTASSPQFAAPISNPFGLSSTYIIASPTFADLDGDGDMDLLVGEYYGIMQYFQNTGSKTNPQFTTPIANPFGLDSVSAYAFPTFADMDGDGDMDLFVGESNGNLQYFENLETSIGLADLTQNFDFTVYPNPVQNILNIDTKEKFDKIEIINSIGEMVMVFNTSENQISIGNLSSGIYTIKISSKDGNFAVQKLIKQ